MVELVKLVDYGIELVGTGERRDLRRRLEQTRRRLLDPSIRVIVVGEFKQGKSQLINALVNAPVCPVDDDVATSVPTVVRHGDPPSAVVVVPKGETGYADGDREPELERRPVKLEELAAHVSESGNPGNRNRLAAAEVYLPRKVLAGGLSLVDSPGVGGLDSAHSLTTLTALPTADAMLLVSDASQEYTEPEIRFLRQAMRICPNVACVLSKTDLYPQWRQVAELDRRHLDRVGSGIPLFPVSSDLRLHAARLRDDELNAESGFPELVTYLRKEILGQAERLQRHSVARDLLSTTEHLGLSLQSELSALEDPESTPQMIAELETAKERADEQRRRSARWQITLGDGVSDLIADMEHDLRDRLRIIQRDAEEAIDAGDPGPIWAQFAEWLEQRVASAVSDTFVWADERAQWLSAQVAEHFARDEVPLPVLRVDDTGGVLDPVEQVPVLDPGHIGPLQKVLIGMRGSYGGVLMFGLLTGIVGMALINPLSVGAGLLLGGKAYREDKEARLKRRQTEAKALVRRQLDDVVFQVGKQLKDRLRLVQRATRDHFTEIAEEHHRSLADSVLAAQKAASTFTLEREDRIRQIKAELKRVNALRKHVQQLDGKPALAGTV
ncbi:dynamin family protein [Arthrobacter crystallopoietes]|uniref:Replication fork clamp-binding protein CrfC (Dynamin-like GTPase family) n=1 Tax=Crystallibacter crystallopoietes TaxID=37928 RepID=A0A1H1DSB9_9MICC|nr:dynamin family protein [Arthrobacter crystallopoietes]AUI50190.1 Isoniazid-inducible protein iniA [Arthrobacter crystallopoietes]SDQ79250.1 Replication fork clamp-binding protein CrfC (dynamin-like GTPase family) [Arthrobacter crystallopoietes]